MDPFDEFDFKPLTEGLGFHKKAEKIKHDIKSSNLGKEKAVRSVPETPPRALLHQTAAELKASAPAMSAMSAGGESSRSASQSISDLINSLPPSLDFLEEKDEPSRKSSAPFSSAHATA